MYPQVQAPPPPRNPYYAPNTLTRIFLPFGKTVLRRQAIDTCECTARLVGNVLWLPLGLVLCIYHMALGLVCFVTIIGIPFGVQHWKFAMMALCPFGTDTSSDALQEHSQYVVVVLPEVELSIMRDAN
ncbi:conserved hypothetical protein [Perkinsus marinus ATCC 50983]|uniref:Inner membrane component domain-containing protein n=1 Tax=Perkinsus marinus (strain ATCC 50983 / TXsc) TaxID=423536 RepID=C5K491_PERM5|nr:conserved hypothetical protein [Perkinsus marinus ATCC 50983]EER20707.1 conserved hypothetical protein [Perkinsus marinus ATCC 50983]|eukprot:XP_002788911.1 conserved hypothetical protein [Perkinsus marinus ATCC 50983]